MSRRNYKIVFLGEQGTGKTCLIERFVTGKFQEQTEASVGIDFVGRNFTFKGQNCRLQLWDTAGSLRFRNLIPNNLKDANCVVFVFDVNNPSSLAAVEGWLSLFRQNKSDRTVAVLCGTKIDVEQSYNKEALAKLIERERMPYYAVSAKSNKDVDALFSAIVEALTAAQEARARKIQKTVDLGRSTLDDICNPPLTKDTFMTSAELSNRDMVPKNQGCIQKLCRVVRRITGWNR